MASAHQAEHRFEGLMTGQHLRGKLVILCLILAVYGILRWAASRPTEPGLPLTPPEQRQPFAIDLTLPALHGPAQPLSKLHGQVVLLNFWATWCYPCRAEMPSMQALYDAYQHADFTILAIASDPQGQSVVGPFAEKHRLTFPILLDTHNTVGAQLQLPGIPTSYLLDKHSRIARMEVGARDWNSPSMRQRIEALLDELPPPGAP
jgi:peroxiredoxin